MEDKVSQKRLHVVVEGRVQGVGFRAFVVQVATALGLAGWVRNRWDNSVEVTAEGPEMMLVQLLGDLQHGPRSSFVSHISVDWLPATGEFTYFSVRRTE
jgi:acylphosphatase